MKILEIAYPHGVESEDLYKFKMIDQVQLEILSDTDSKASTIFKKGGTITGTPALVTIINPDTRQITKVEGVLIREVGGSYLIPKVLVEKESSLLTETTKSAEEVIDEAGQISKEVVSDVSKFDTQKTLGFTKKQLLVMALTALVVIKVFK